MAVLKKLTIENFRRIPGRHELNLDAPVVLIHGRNASGKTSILSAIELALTGEMQALRRTDKEILKWLPHREGGSDSGYVKVETEKSIQHGFGEFRVHAGRLEGKPALDEPRRKFFSDSCYLAQSMLSRLLEIYQHRDFGLDDSPLTRFVKELLGLDQYDALIAGLSVASDVGQFRERIPHFWAARYEVPEIRRRLEDQKRELSEVEMQVAAIEESTLPSIRELISSPALDLAEALETLRGINFEQTIQSLETHRLTIKATLDQAQSIDRRLGPSPDLRRAEAIEAEAIAAFSRWDQTVGKFVRTVTVDLSTLMMTDIAPGITDPDLIRAAAEQTAAEEIEHLLDAVQDDADAGKQIDALSQRIKAISAESARVDGEISKYKNADQQIIGMLSAAHVHMMENTCPVCGRDFAETGAEPLGEHISRKMDKAHADLDRLQKLLNQKAQLTSDAADMHRNSIAYTARKMSPDKLLNLHLRLVRIRQLHEALKALAEQAQEGRALWIELGRATRTVEELRARDKAHAALTATVSLILRELNVPIEGRARSPLLELDTLRDTVEKKLEDLHQREALRKDLLRTVGRYEHLKEQHSNLQASIAVETEKLNAILGKTRASDQALNLAEDLSNNVQAARGNIIKRVFDAQLNSVWKNLFMRLAPNEKFIPAFVVPGFGDGRIQAQLETQHQDGGKGGDPQAMLSAGNLNTAALTLFLALHLNVEPMLPCLIMDDPVQSMDEVHITHLAALFRTLSKQHNRQIIVAVHDRSLFDYMALELSPAYPGDRLIKIELSQVEGKPSIHSQLLSFKPDFAIAA